MHNLKRIAMVFALAVGVTGIASAVPATGTVLINLGPITTDISDPLSLAATITTIAGGPTVALGGTGDFAPPVVSAGDPATLDPLSFSATTDPPGIVGLEVRFGPLVGPDPRFLFTVDSVVLTDLDDSGTGISFLTIITQGTFVDSMGVFDTTTSAGMGFVVGEACVAGTCSLGGIALFNAEQFVIPEPATLALFGSAMIALAGLKLRKSKSRG